MAAVTLKGNPVTLNGTFPKVGQIAPDFALVSKDLKDAGLKDFAGKRKVLNIVSSLDTTVCAASARKFNEAASRLKNMAVLDENNKVLYTQLVPEITQEPNYEAALAALK